MTLKTLTVVCPLPNSDLHAHTSRSGWKKIKATRTDKDMGTICALRALNGKPPPIWTRASLVYLFWFTQNKNQDLFNFAQMAKALLDGVVHARIITDDRHSILRPCTVDLGGYDKINPRLEMIFTEIPQTY